MVEGGGWKRVARRIRVPMGFVFAGVFLWLARPTVWTLAGSLALVAPGLWLRGYAAGYIRKNAEITTTGPYGYTRNPLYLGSLMIALGFGAAAASWVLLAALAGAFAVIYIPTILSEEEYLRGRFDGYEGYMREVPRLLPRFWLKRQKQIPPLGYGMTNRESGMANEEQPQVLRLRSAPLRMTDDQSGGFSRERYMHHREYNAAMGAGAIYAALALRLLLEHHAQR